MLKSIASACVFAVLAMSTVANAQTADRRTFFTFSQPFTLPGVTLPAGKYLFRIVDETSGRRVVQVLNAEGTQSYAMLTSIPAQRLDAPPNPEIRFMETATGTPAAVKTWWYPGNTSGYEFIYPKDQALKLAKAAESLVLTTAAASSSTEDLKTADLARVSSSGSQTAVSVSDKPDAAAASGTVQGGEIAASTFANSDAAKAVTPAVPEASAAPESRLVENRPRTRLPQTAGSLPMTMVLATLMMATGVGLLLWSPPRS